MIRIVVIAEHLLPVQALVAELGQDARLEVTAVTGSGEPFHTPQEREALDAAQVVVYLPRGPEDSLPRPQPTPGGQAWVVVDLMGHVGLEHAVRLGAHGYVGSGEPLQVLVERVVLAASGRPAFPPGPLAELQVALRQVGSEVRGLGNLTAQQLQIVRWVGQGVTARQIAQMMGISETAVRGRLTRVMKRLNVTNQQELAALAGLAGLYHRDVPPAEDGGH